MIWVWGSETLSGYIEFYLLDNSILINDNEDILFTQIPSSKNWGRKLWMVRSLTVKNWSNKQCHLPTAWSWMNVVIYLCLIRDARRILCRKNLFLLVHFWIIPEIIHYNTTFMDISLYQFGGQKWLLEFNYKGRRRLKEFFGKIIHQVTT